VRTDPLHAILPPTKRCATNYNPGHRAVIRTMVIDASNFHENKIKISSFLVSIESSIDGAFFLPFSV